MKLKRTLLLLAIALFANLALVVLTGALALLRPGVFGRYGFEVSVAVPSIGALISFLWILTRSMSAKSVTGRTVLAIAGTLIMMAVFVVLLLPALSAGAELSNKLHAIFPGAFPSPEGRRP